MCVHACKGKGMCQNLEYGGCGEGAAVKGLCVCVCMYAHVHVRVCARVPCMHACVCHAHTRKTRGGGGGGGRNVIMRDGENVIG